MTSPELKPVPRLKPLLLLLAGSFLFTSCGDDPELVRKRKEQDLEIARLRGEVALVEEKLRNLPPDRSAELAEAREQAEQQKAEVERLEAEIAELEARKRSLESEFEDYRRKYVVR